MSDKSDSPQRWWLWLWLLIFATLAIRGGVLAWRFEHLTEDPDAYRLLAENLANHGLFGQVDAKGNGSPTAFRPPGYPWLLSWLVTDGSLSSMAVAVLHLVLGVGTVGLVFLIAKRLISPQTGLLAALLVAVDPILLGQSTLVMTETIAAFLVASAWWLIVVADCGSDDRTSRCQGTVIAVAMGATLSAGFFCRPIFIVWAVLIVVHLIFDGYMKDRRSWLTASVVVGIMAVSVGLWTWRNNSVLGHPVWATSHGGYTLLLGNNPSFYDYLREGKVGEKWQAEPFHNRWAMRRHGDPTNQAFWTREQIDVSSPRRSLTEIEDDRLAYESAKTTIHRQPGMFFYSCLVRVGRLWSPMPHAGDYPVILRYAIGFYYVGLFGCSVFGIWMLGARIFSPPWIAILLLAFALSCVHSLYWSNMRMRGMVMPLFAVAAAAGCTRTMKQRSKTALRHQG